MSSLGKRIDVDDKVRDIEAKIFLAKAEMDKAKAEMDKAKADVDKAKADVDKEKVFKTNAEFVDNFEEKCLKLIFDGYSAAMQRYISAQSVVITLEGNLNDLRKGRSFGLSKVVVSDSVNKTIRNDGLPELEKRSFLSSSSSSVITGHCEASLKDAEFNIHDSSQIFLKSTNNSLLWNLNNKKAGKFKYASEADISFLVRNALIDIISEISLSEDIEINAEVGTFEVRPDFWILLYNALPVGVVEVKKPGVNVLNHPRVLDEVYDYLLQLKNFYNTQSCFAILTTYEEWRICFLDDVDSREMAKRSENMKVKENVTPEKVKSYVSKATWSKNMSLHGASDEPEKKEEEDNGSNIDSEREMCGTPIYKSDNPILFNVISSALYKMKNTQHLPNNSDPFDDIDSRTLIKLTKEGYFWSRIKKSQFHVNHRNLFPHPNSKTFYLLEDLGNPGDFERCVGSGHAWLSCNARGCLCVIKFKREIKKSYNFEREVKFWDKLYSINARILILNNREALLMPHFNDGEKTLENFKLIEKCLHENFHEKGYKHLDIRWRNVGFYIKEGVKKAIVYDLESVIKLEKDEDSNWIAVAIAELSKNMDIMAKDFSSISLAEGVNNKVNIALDFK